VTVTFTCIFLCGTTTVNTIATHTTNGSYTAAVTPAIGGIYKVEITMASAYTAAFPLESALVESYSEIVAI